MGSLFDGIGGFPLAAVRSGIRPVWASEIEAFPGKYEKQRNTVCIFYFHTAPGKQKITDQPQTIYSEFP